jgi:hypothetical protein
MDAVILLIMRILSEGRMRLIQGLDLQGLALGAETGLTEGPPLIAQVLEKCPRVRRLFLQVRVWACEAGEGRGGWGPLCLSLSAQGRGPRRRVC